MKDYPEFLFCFFYFVGVKKCLMIEAEKPKYTYNKNNETGYLCIETSWNRLPSQPSTNPIQPKILRCGMYK